uniref:Uncharacterized protein n=1 Tax=Mesocestoides corti TaxID=53468 RepID=A0A5K3FUG3_MESCO
GVRECRAGYFNNHEECKEPSQKLRTASLLRTRHARKTGSQPEKDTNGVEYIRSGMASVVDSDGRSLTCGSGL